MSQCRRLALQIAGLLAVLRGVASADDYEREPINYRTAPAANAVTRLQLRIDAGQVRLPHETTVGYLPAVLRELGSPVSSQTLVFSKTSFQRDRISPSSPRALYFNDETYVGYCRNGEVLEVATADPNLGTVFYTLEQEPAERPKFVRQGDSRMSCHAASPTEGVPGLLVRSVYPDAKGLPILSAGSFRIDHTSPLEQRWGGWYVTGTHGGHKHLGNLVIRKRPVPEPIDNNAGMNVTDLAGRVDLRGYLTGQSDLVALMVLEHQAQGHNLLVRANFQTRQALHMEAALNRELGEKPDHRWDSTTTRLKAAAEPLVKYLLFCGEATLSAPLRGTSGFAEEFAARGPHDAQGRSLREFDLQRRMFKYPCSYLIYTAAFDDLPAAVKEYVLQRLWDVLNGKDVGDEFAHLSDSDRRAIREILAATKPGLPEYWRASHSETPQ